MQRWTISRTDANAFRLEFDATANEPVRLLLMSDEHYDNQHCDRALLKRHLEEAKAINAPTIHVGDTFCCMQGKWDKRADQDQLRPELRGNNYLDRVVNEADALYGHYAEQFALLMRGNHEGAILQHHQTDLVERLGERLRLRGAHVQTCGISAWLRVALKTKRKTLSRDVFCHHGYGGGGEVTRGMIDNNRTRSQYIADVYFSGHIHRANEDENCPIYLSQAGTVEKREQFFLRGGPYTDDDQSAWQIGRGQAARPKGGWWLELTLINGTHGDELRVNPMRAR